MNAKTLNITVNSAKIASGIDRIIASVVVREKKEVRPPGGSPCR